MSSTQSSAASKSRNRQQQQQHTFAVQKIVESANSLPAQDFFAAYCPAELIVEISDFSLDGMLKLSIKWGGPVQLGCHLQTCFNLIEETSANDYRHSEMKWSSAKKQKEMVLPDLRYIILMDQSTTQIGTNEPVAAGFISFMITYEDGHEVVYIYEIHFAPPWQGKGLGKKLMNIVETIGRNAGVEKSMLTVFKANDRAVTWYLRQGYSEDEFSPGPRRLRNGTVKEPSYMILSKNLRASPSAEDRSRIGQDARLEETGR